MQFTLVDQISVAGTYPNEDRVSFNNHAAWVIDGATDVAEIKCCDGPSDAAWYAQALHEVFTEHLATPAPSLSTLIDQAVATIAKRFHAAAHTPIQNRHQMPSAAGAILQLDKTVAHAVSLGDCTIMKLGASGAEKVVGVDEADIEIRTELAKRHAETKVAAENNPDHQKDHQTTRADLMPLLRKMRDQMNRPDGYGIFSIEPPPHHLIQTGRCNVKLGDRMLLASDGFMRLVDVFELYRLEDLATAIIQRGLLDLTAELRDHERRDANCRNEPRTKCHDDASALLLEITD